MKVTYRERNFIDRYKCIDHERTIYVCRHFWNGNLLYAYTDRYNVKAIAKEDIISMEKEC